MRVLISCVMIAVATCLACEHEHRQEDRLRVRVVNDTGSELQGVRVRVRQQERVIDGLAPDASVILRFDPLTQGEASFSVDATTSSGVHLTDTVGYADHSTRICTIVVHDAGSGPFDFRHGD